MKFYTVALWTGQGNALDQCVVLASDEGEAFIKAHLKGCGMSLTDDEYLEYISNLDIDEEPVHFTYFDGFGFHGYILLENSRIRKASPKDMEMLEDIRFTLVQWNRSGTGNWAIRDVPQHFSYGYELKQAAFTNLNEDMCNDVRDVFIDGFYLEDYDPRFDDFLKDLKLYDPQMQKIRESKYNLRKGTIIRSASTRKGR